MWAPMIAVIAGATGLTGSKILRFLLEDPAFTRVIVITRRSLSFQHPKIEEQLITDFSKLSDSLSIPAGATFLRTRYHTQECGLPGSLSSSGF